MAWLKRFPTSIYQIYGLIVHIPGEIVVYINEDYLSFEPHPPNDKGHIGIKKCKTSDAAGNGTSTRSSVLSHPQQRSLKLVQEKHLLAMFVPSKVSVSSKLVLRLLLLMHPLPAPIQVLQKAATALQCQVRWPQLSIKNK